MDERKLCTPSLDTTNSALGRAHSVKVDTLTLAGGKSMQGSRRRESPLGDRRGFDETGVVGCIFNNSQAINIVHGYVNYFWPILCRICREILINSMQSCCYAD